MPQNWLALFIVSIFTFLVVYIYVSIRHREKIKLLNLMAWVGIGIAFFMVIHITTLMIFPTKIQEVSLPIKILNENKEAKRGEPLIIQFHIKKYVNYGSTIYPSIICDDGSYFTFPVRQSNVPPGEGTYTVSNAYYIPENAPFTYCHTRATDVFELNILRKKTYILESEKFKVIE
jgi:hypothetical protein